jgi:tyrosine decarboxylase / aspartate 1-decarboxylase
MKHWDKLPYQEIKNRVFAALKENIGYHKGKVLGVPGSYLEEEEFYPRPRF